MSLQCSLSHFSVLCIFVIVISAGQLLYICSGLRALTVVYMANISGIFAFLGSLLLLCRQQLSIIMRFVMKVNIRLHIILNLSSIMSFIRKC